MKSKKLLVTLLALIFIVCTLTACGAKASTSDAPAADAPAADAPAAMAPESEYSNSSDTLSSGTDVNQTGMPENQKIITTRHINAQTEDMEVLLNTVNRKIQELGGYVEAQDIYNGSAYASYRYRNANLTIRIPAQKLAGFVDCVSANANIVSENTTTENVTLSYAATESRILVLEAERDRLLEFMDQAETMKDMLQIEERLTDVIAELERVTSQLRVYDNLVNYSTVYLNIEEVKEYTEIEEEPETVWEQISAGFTKSLKNLGKGFTNFFVFIVTKLPYLVLVGGVVVVVLLVIKRRNKGKAPKETKSE